MRRIFAEDPNWNLAGVPSLMQLCFNHLVKNYASKPVLQELKSPEFQEKLINNLSVDLPLQITAEIENEEYWKKCVEAKTDWGLCVVGDHGGSWKRLYFERSLQALLENCRPEDEAKAMDGPGGILEICELSSPFVKTLNLLQLVPPSKGEPEEPVRLAVAEEEPDQDDEEEDEHTFVDHIDMTPIIRKLKNLEDLKLSYMINNCGMNFKWSMFGITSGDCTSLARGIRDYSTISCLSLQRSMIGDRKIRTLCSYLLGNKTIKKLDLGHNSISCSGARALAKLLNNSVLEELDVRDNKIYDKGAKALGKTLRNNSSLKILNLRLNRFGDEGGRLFFEGLGQQGAGGNKTLRDLNVSCNSLGDKSATALCKYVDHNPSLATLDLTCNELGEKAGRQLLEALDGNACISDIDMRLTQFDKDTEFQINVRLRSNAKQK